MQGQVPAVALGCDPFCHPVSTNNKLCSFKYTNKSSSENVTHIGNFVRQKKVLSLNLLTVNYLCTTHKRWNVNYTSIYKLKTIFSHNSLRGLFSERNAHQLKAYKRELSCKFMQTPNSQSGITISSTGLHVIIWKRYSQLSMK